MDSKIFTNTLVPEQSEAAFVPPGVKPTVAVYILDGSSSMRRFGSEPLMALNSGIRILQRSVAAQYITGLVLSFAHEGCMERDLQRISGMVQLDRYRTGNGSRIYRSVMVPLEAMVKAATEAFHLKSQAPFHVDLGVFTDGEDVGSTTEELERLRSAACIARGFGWNLQVHGFGVNAQRIAHKMGFAHDDRHARNWKPEGASFSASVADFSQASAEGTRMRTGMLDPASAKSDRHTPTPI